MGGQQFLDCLVEPLVGDGRGLAVGLLEDVLLDRAAGNALRKRGDSEDPDFRFGGPGQAGLAVLFDPRNVFGTNPTVPQSRVLQGASRRRFSACEPIWVPSMR